MRPSAPGVVKATLVPATPTVSPTCPMFVHAPPLTGCTSTGPAPVEPGSDASAAMYESDIATLCAARPRFRTAPPDQRCTTSSVAVPLPFKSGWPLTREPLGHPGCLGVGPAAS